MYTQNVWRSDLPISECEKRLGDLPKRRWLIQRGSQPLVVARMSGRMFYLFVAGTAERVLLAPYFHGFLIDRHGMTEVRGRVIPGPAVQSALFGGSLALVLLAIGTVTGAVRAPAWAVLLVVVMICSVVAVAGWRGARQGAALIAASIERAFEAHRLTSDWSRRRAV